MSCDAPLSGYYKGGAVNPGTGKRSIIFKVNGSHSGVRMSLPCGKCSGCRLEYSRRWAMRLMHENKMHKQSMFLSLTYRPEDLPHVGTLVAEHLQLFHKRFHNRLLDARGFGIRYYGIGEYGETTRRPHYHSIIFGYRFPDLKYYSTSPRGDIIYTSKECDDIWKLGDCKIGDVTYASAMYVAKYSMKKVDGALREAGHYEVRDADGVIHERLPEFSHMSRRPGIGSTYFDKYGGEIAQHDTVIVDGKEVPSIRYYDLRIDPARLIVLKRNRRRKVVWSERQSDRRRVKEVLRLMRLKRNQRKDGL